jgi:NAD(P)-dependent dehydrogenase (short-subunit alcohol dehydrogenase family)
MKLKDRIAIVTGGSSGIGRKIAAAFAREGAKVTIADIKTPASDQSVPHRYIATDVSRFADCSRLVETTVNEFGRLDILCNNAGVFEGTKNAEASEIDEEVWDRVIAVNLKGTFLCSKAALPVMQAQKSGVIINMGSISGIVSTSTGRNAAYSASKAGIIALTRNIAVGNAKFGIRANCICPGYIETPMTDSIFQVFGAEDLKRSIGDQQLMGRFGTAAEIAQAAVFLASDDSSFMTGAPLLVDGGYTAT